MELDLQPIDENNTLDLQPVDTDYVRPEGDKGWEIYAAPPKESPLDKIGKCLKWVAQTPAVAYMQGNKNVRSAELNAKEIFTALNPDEESELETLENSAPKNYGVRDVKYADENITNLLPRMAAGARKYYAQTIEQLPYSVEAMKAGGLGSVIGGTVGAVGGAAVGGLFSPTHNPIQGALDGFKAGIRLGGGIGAAKKTWELEAGSARQELKNFRDKDGNPLTEDIINSTAISVGAANAVLEVVGLDAILKTVPGYEKYIKGINKKVSARIITDETVRAKMMDLGKRYLQSSSVEVGTEMLQEVSNIIGEEIAKNRAGNYDTTPMDEHIKRIIETGIASIGPTLLLGGAVTTISAVNILRYNGMKEVEAKIVAENMTDDEKVQLINNNEDALVDMGKQHLTDLQRQEIETDFYNKTINAGVDENQAFSAAKLMGVFAKKFGSNVDSMKNWYDKLFVTNKPIEGGISVDVQADNANTFHQSAAMYNDKTSQNIKEFFAKVQNNPDDINKVKYPIALHRLSIPASAMKHSEKHKLSANEWQEIVENIDNMFSASKIADANAYSDNNYRIGIETKNKNYYGLVIGLTNKDNYICTAFKSTKNGIEAFVQERGKTQSKVRLEYSTEAPFSIESNNIINYVKEKLNPNVNKTYYQENENKSLEDLHNEYSEKKQGFEYLGYFQEGQDKNIIGIMENANPSTLIHEMGHLFLSGLNELALSDETAKAQLDEVNNWLGYNGGEYTVSQQEKFAKSFEAYLYEGKAPTNKLLEVFNNFKEWLRSVYSHINEIGVELSPEARKIFDNLFSENHTNERDMEIKKLIEKVKNIDLSDKLTDSEARHKEAAYDILSSATGKNKQWLKTVLEAKSQNKSIQTKKENIELMLENVDDKISGSDGFLPEWLEFFSEQELYEDDSLLAQAAYDAIVNRSFKTQFDEYDFLDKTEAQYSYLMDVYKKSVDKDIPMAAFFEWIDTVDSYIQDDYIDKFQKDVAYIERFENMDKFEQAKEIILKAAKDANSYSLNSVEKYRDIVMATIKGLDFLRPQDKAKLTANILQAPTTGFLESQIDSILDIAKTMDDINYKKNLMAKIHEELQGTKNIKQSNKTVGKYDYQTNKLFEKLREIDKMTVEEANDARLNISELSLAEDEGISFEDKMVNRYLCYKADGMTYADTSIIKALYDDIKKIKLAGKNVKSEIELFNKLNNSKMVDELVSVLESKKDAKGITKWYNNWICNWESALNTIFNGKIRDKYSLLLAETKSDGWIYEKKKNFEREVANIYGLKGWDFDKKILENLAYKMTFMESVREYDTEGNIVKEKLIPKEMNRMEMLLAWMWSKNEVLHKRLINQFGESELERMFDELSKQDMALGDLMMKTVNSCYPEANEMFIKKYGLDLPKVSCYFPSTVERSSEIDLLNDFTQKSMNPSFIKRRTKSENIAMEFSNPVEIMYSHIDGMGKFINMTETLDRTNKIFKDKTVKRLVKNKYGEDAYKTLVQLLANSSYKQNATIFNGMDKINNSVIQNWITGNVVFKASVGIKQLFSASNYATNMPYLTWQNGFLKALAHPKQTIDYMMKIPYLKARFGGSQQNEFLKQTIENSAFAKTKKFKEFLALNIRLGDMGAIVFGGKPYIDYLIAEKGMSEEQAINEFILSTQRTQQSAATSSLNNFQVSASRDSWKKLMTAYQNAQFQYFRMAGDAIVSVANGEMTKKQCAKVLFQYMFMQPLLYRVGTSLSLITLAATGDSDDLKEDIIGSIFDLNASCISLWGKLYQYALSRFIEKNNGHFPETTPLIGDIEKELQQISKEGASLEDFLHFVGYGVQVGAGIPINPIANSLSGFGDMINGDFVKGSLKILGWSENRAAHVVGENTKRRSSKKSKKKLNL